MNKNCEGLASVQCCNFDIKNCKYRSGDDDCWNPEVVKKALEKAFLKYSKPKRTPDTNGVLPLTESELDKFRESFYNFSKIKIEKQHNLNLIRGLGSDNIWWQIYDYKAIKWILDKFELGVDSHV